MLKRSRRSHPPPESCEADTDRDYLDRVMPRDGPRMSDHLSREIEQAFREGPLEPGEPVDGCDCGKCRLPGLPPYVGAIATDARNKVDAMSKQKRVWIIEAGEYSDYHVVGIYSTRENAERVRNALVGSGWFFYDRPEVAERILDPGVEALNEGLALYHVLMLRDGTVEKVERKGALGETSGVEGRISVWRRSEAPAYRDTGTPDCLNTNVWARDEEHAVKIANEHRTRIIAEGRWESETP